MRSIILIEHHRKQQHYWKMKAHVFSSVASALYFIPEDCAGLSSADANDVLPSAGISHQSVLEPRFPVIIPLTNRRRGGWLGFPTFTPFVLSPYVNIMAHFKVRLLINHATLWGLLMVVLFIHQLTHWSDLSLWDSFWKQWTNIKNCLTQVSCVLEENISASAHQIDFSMR